MSQFQIRQCMRTACRFRFPVTGEDRIGSHCPLCGAPTQIMSEQRLPPETRTGVALPKPQPLAVPKPQPLAVLLDNVRSTFNVGSIFRTADGAGVEQIYLCGITPTPRHPKVGKTALGAEQVIAWSHHHNALDL